MEPKIQLIKCEHLKLLSEKYPQMLYSLYSCKIV